MNPDEVVEEKTEPTTAPESTPEMVVPEVPVEPQATSTPAVDNPPAPEIPPEAVEAPRASDTTGGAKDDNSAGEESQNTQGPRPKAEGGVGSIRTLTREMLKALSVKAHAVTEGRKRKKLERIMGELEKKGNSKGLRSKVQGITNDEVQILLGVSDATAERYLGQLVKEGKLTKVSKGRFTEYRRK
jgi:hypothetical protein